MCSIQRTGVTQKHRYTNRHHVSVDQNVWCWSGKQCDTAATPVHFYQVLLWYSTCTGNPIHPSVVLWPCGSTTMCLVSINTTLIIIITQHAFETASWNTFWGLFPSKLILPWTKGLPHTHTHILKHTHTSETTAFSTVGVLGRKWERFRGLGYELKAPFSNNMSPLCVNTATLLRDTSYLIHSIRSNGFKLKVKIGINELVMNY